MKKHYSIIRTLRSFLCVLPAFFWLFLGFGMEEPSMALATVLSAIIHEIGHIAYIFFVRRLLPCIRGDLSGFRIKSDTKSSHREKIMSYVAGPLANLFTCIIFLLISANAEDFAMFFATVNAATAISNLLPIIGYDGYGMLYTIIEAKSNNATPLRLLFLTSMAFSFGFRIISLYLIDRYGGGYWIFGIFIVMAIKHLSEELK